jgi:hypothetical protein
MGSSWCQANIWDSPPPTSPQGQVLLGLCDNPSLQSLWTQEELQEKLFPRLLRSASLPLGWG